MADLAAFANIETVRSYFQSVERLDGVALQSLTAEAKPSVDNFMALWESDGGQLTISGPGPIGVKTYKGHEEIEGFYSKKAEGFGGLITASAKAVSGVNVPADNQAVVTGTRTVVTPEGEGMEISFTHSFHFNEDRKIRALHIHIGDPRNSPTVPAGKLKIEDMGKLASVAWMVA